MQKLGIFFLATAVFCLRQRLLDETLDETCDAMNKSYALYLIDANMDLIPEQVGCNFTFTFVTGDCSYSSPILSGVKEKNVCVEDSSLICDGVDTNFIGGFVVSNCNGEIKAEAFKPLTKFNLMEELKLSTSNIEVNLMVASKCNAEVDSDPMEWKLTGLRTCAAPKENNPSDLEGWGIYPWRGPHMWFGPQIYRPYMWAPYPWWGFSGRFYGPRYFNRCHFRGWRMCWRPWPFYFY